MIFVIGLILLIGSYWWGLGVVWIGAPLIFLSIIFSFADKE